MEGHMRKVLFVKGGQGGGTTPRVSIPMEYIKALEITKDQPEVKITLEGKKIVIEKEEKRMMKATIYMKDDNTVYTGATAKAKTLEKAIMTAHGRTENEWNLRTWAEVDGKKYSYTVHYNSETGKDEISVSEMEG